MSKRKNVVSVFEHEEWKIDYDTSLSKRAKAFYSDQLLKLNDRYEQKYFTPTAKGFKFNQYVGVIQVNDLIIEVLPKADRPVDESDANDKQNWRHVLIEMLHECRKLNVDSLTWATLHTRSHVSLVDLYFEIFVKELEQLLHKGLIKRYSRRRGNLNKLKGKLVFNEHLKQNLVHKERFVTEHQTYDHDHLLNHILLEALRITGIMGPPLLQDQVQRLELLFPEVQAQPISHKDFARIRWDRKTEPYRKAIQLAWMIICHFHPDLKGGKNNTLAILFDMNELFEEYVYRKLKCACQAEGYSSEAVVAQKSKLFWQKADKSLQSSLQPDILVTLAPQHYLIIDTKWKKGGDPSIDDLRQIFSYTQYFDATCGLLMYPMMETKDQPAIEGGNYASDSFSLPGKFDGLRCQIAYANIIRKENGHIRLNKQLGADLLKMVSETIERQYHSFS